MKMLNKYFFGSEKVPMGEMIWFYGIMLALPIIICLTTLGVI